MSVASGKCWFYNLNVKWIQFLRVFVTIHSLTRLPKKIKKHTQFRSTHTHAANNLIFSPFRQLELRMHKRSRETRLRHREKERIYCNQGNWHEKSTAPTEAAMATVVVATALAIIKSMDFFVARKLSNKTRIRNRKTVQNTRIQTSLVAATIVLVVLFSILILSHWTRRCVPHKYTWKSLGCVTDATNTKDKAGTAEMESVKKAFAFFLDGYGPYSQTCHNIGLTWIDDNLSVGVHFYNKLPLLVLLLHLHFYDFCLHIKRAFFCEKSPAFLYFHSHRSFWIGLQTNAEKKIHTKDSTLLDAKWFDSLWLTDGMRQQHGAAREREKKRRK